MKIIENIECMEPTYYLTIHVIQRSFKENLLNQFWTALSLSHLHIFCAMFNINSATINFNDVLAQWNEPYSAA